MPGAAIVPRGDTDTPASQPVESLPELSDDLTGHLTTGGREWGQPNGEDWRRHFGTGKPRPVVHRSG